MNVFERKIKIYELDSYVELNQVELIGQILSSVYYAVWAIITAKIGNRSMSRLFSLWTVTSLAYSALLAYSTLLIRHGRKNKEKLEEELENLEQDPPLGQFTREEQKSFFMLQRQPIIEMVSNKSLRDRYMTRTFINAFSNALFAVLSILAHRRGLVRTEKITTYMFVGNVPNMIQNIMLVRFYSNKLK